VILPPLVFPGSEVEWEKLGHLGQHDRDRIISILCCAAQGRQDKNSLSVTGAGINTLNFINGNTALKNIY